MIEGMKWGVIDIECSGIDEKQEQIIDLGYILFEGTQVVAKYSSLVALEPQRKLSPFITELTGIDSKMLAEAKSWEDLRSDWEKLADYTLLAHNAAFEKKFLAPHFKIQLADTLLFLAILFPERSRLNLESFLQDFNIAQGEEHRGYADSRDLLKVVLSAIYIKRYQKEYYQSFFKEHGLEEHFFTKLLGLASADLESLAQVVDHSLEDLEVISEEDLPPSRQGEEQLFNGPGIEKILRNEEAFRAILPKYQFREQQLHMAKRVGQSFSHDIHAMVEAPTGTGKTLSYLIPAFLFAQAKQQQVLIVTATKALQEQMKSQDIPVIKKRLNCGDEIKISTLIGSDNHYCELYFRNNTKNRGAIASESEKLSAVYFESLFHHNRTEEEKVHRLNNARALKNLYQEIALADEDIKVDFKACLGGECPYHRDCSYLNGLRTAQKSDIIIGNHALFFKWPKSLKNPQYMIVDEAHKLEEEVTKAKCIEILETHFFRFSALLQRQEWLGAILYLAQQDLIPLDESEKELQEFVQMTLGPIENLLKTTLKPLEEIHKARPRYSDKYRNEILLTEVSASAKEIISKIEKLAQIIKKISDKFQGVRKDLEDLKVGSEPYQVTALSKAKYFLSLTGELAQKLTFFLNPGEHWLQVVSYQESIGVSFCAFPINIAQELQEEIYEKTNASFLTSATLGLFEGPEDNLGSEWMLGYNRIPQDRRFRYPLVLDPVFDYKKQTRVFVVTNFVSFSHPHYVAEVLQKIKDIIIHKGGRTLLLFSARSRFELARDYLMTHYRDCGLKIFYQGMGNRVVEDFKKTDRAVLLGLESFAEGVDIPGKGLEFLFIDKIPDIRQDLVIKKRREYFDQHLAPEFYHYFLNQRARKLHQRLGRLIRTVEDTGTALIIDSRLKRWKKNTKLSFYQMMRPYEIEEIELDHFIEDQLKK